MSLDMTNLTVTEGNDQFYPTPDYVAEKMLADIDWDLIQNVLEPSAGKGDLVYAVIKSYAADYRRERKVNIDCIEIDPYLRAILKENYSSEWLRPLREKKAELESLDNRAITGGPDDERIAKVRAEIRELEKVRSYFRNANVNIIHDNFLTYRGWRRYDLVLMNPPFAEGDMHLLKALDIQKDGGAIICLLNAETIRNPYTNSRKLLMRELDKYEAQISFLENAFTQAERRADVDVAIVRVNIPHEEESHSDIWERMERAERELPPEDIEVTDLVAGDYIEQAVTHFRIECAASMELIRQYTALRPYIFEDLEDKGFHNNAILTLSVGRESNYLQEINIDKYLQMVRLKYWKALFKNEKFVGKLTSELRARYSEKVEQMANYDFTLFNIKTIMAEMDSQVVDGIKAAILTLFDKLTAEHSWYPESKQNIHYYSGWATNKAHKIGKKSIIPTHGMFSSYSWKSETFEVNTAYSVLSDIEKVFDYLSGNEVDDSDIRERLQIANDNGKTRNIPLKYFDVDLYKKGTTHIKYRDMELIDKFNIYAGRNRNWLPPNYGKKTYSEMTSEEKAVVDDFQGAAAYAKVLAKSGFYLSEPTRSVGLITDGKENS